MSLGDIALVAGMVTAAVVAGPALILLFARGRGPKPGRRARSDS